MLRKTFELFIVREPVEPFIVCQTVFSFGCRRAVLRLGNAAGRVSVRQRSGDPHTGPVRRLLYHRCGG